MLFTNTLCMVAKYLAFSPHRFQDVSNIRDVPDHQEVFADPSRDESSWISSLTLLIMGVLDGFFETLLLNRMLNVVIEQSGVHDEPCLMYNNMPAVVTNTVGQMAISKGRQGRKAQNIVKVYLANFHLKGVDTDVVVTAYESILINPLSESTGTVGAGLAVPAAQTGCMPIWWGFK